jgi:hypothetical protein
MDPRLIVFTSLAPGAAAVVLLVIHSNSAGAISPA